MQPWVRGSKCLQTHQGGNWPLRAPDTRVSKEWHTNRNSSKGPQEDPHPGSNEATDLTMVTGARMVPGVRRGGVKRTSSVIL